MSPPQRDEDTGDNQQMNSDETLNGNYKKNGTFDPEFVNGNGTGKTKTDKETDKKDEKSNEPPPVSYFRLYSYASRNDGIKIFIGFLGALVTGALTPLNTLIFGSLVDAMVQQANAAADGPDDVDMTEMWDWFMDQVFWFAIYSTILGFSMLIATYIQIMVFNHAAHCQIFRIRSAFLKSTLNKDIEWYDTNKSNEFASRMNEDLQKLEDGLGEKVIMFTHFMVAAIGSFILAFVKGWLLALICLISLPVTMISVGIVAIITSRLAKREMAEYAKAGSIAEEVFSAIRTVVAFGGEEKESVRYIANLSAARILNIKKAFFSGLGFGLLWFFIYASYALAFWYGVGLVLEQADWPEDEIVYTPGVMFTVFFSVMMGSFSFGASSPYIETFGIAKGAASKVFSILDTESKINPMGDSGEQPTKCDGNIMFSNVFFNYPSRPDVNILQGINLDIKKGETVALVGSSGCGKSTCIQLIQRFYDPDSGSIYLDGRNVKELNVNWLRQRVGVVGQEPILFGTTIYENIQYGYLNATKEDIERAAITANAHNFIMKLPDGYQTLVGERGAQMSGGQKQRIAIARALVRNPEILLLDEATSALDTASESKVQQALEKASEGRTTVIVAHRLSTIRNADKIFVLKEGQVREIGNHDELMTKQGIYYSLVTTQIAVISDKDKNFTEHKGDLTQFDEDDQEIYVDKVTDTSENEIVHPIAISKVIKWNAPEWLYIVIGSICSLIMGAAMPLFAIIFGEVVEVLSHPDPEYVRSQTDLYSLYFVLTGILVGVATFLQIWTYGVAGEKLTERVRGWAFTSMLRQEVAFFDDPSHGTGTLCSRLSNDAAAVQGATGQRIGTVVQSFSTLVLSIGIGMFYEWRLGLVALAFTPFLLVASYMEIKMMEQQSMGTAKALEHSTKIAVEAVSNIRTVISLGRERMFYDKYVNAMVPAFGQAKRNVHVRGLVYGLARGMMFFAYGATMYYGGHLVVNYGVSIGTVFIVTQALIMGTIGIANAFAYAPNFQKGLIAASKIDKLMNREPLVQSPRNIPEMKTWAVDGNVDYKDVRFFYPSRPNTMVLQGLNLGVLQGKTVALVGSSGCGKSTTIQLLERFYDSTSGTVEIDKINVRSVSLRNLRSNLGIVSQEPALFDRTIRDNIAYGDNSRDVSLEEIMDCAKQANIHTFITSLPLGYDTPLGDKGTQLSGGQKQRVAIARALVRKPKILLLDEATSALDMESEKVVQQALDVAKKGRTCMTIAHRLTTIIDSDIIFVFANGKVKEQGTHDELMQLRGIYYNLYALQSSVK